MRATTNRRRRPRFRLLALLGSLLLLAAAAGAQAAGPTNDDCLACHSDTALKREDGRALAFDEKRLAVSVHGVAGLSCTDCHADLAAATEFPHAAKLAVVDCAPC